MKKLLIILAVFTTLTVQAQKEAYHWYFGYNTGLDFSNTQTLISSNLGSILGVPKETTGPIKTGEGCFSISDGDGNFLFASDGITVYNRNLKEMQNGTGLLGDPSGTNSGIVIPIPGSKTLFYLVTAPESPRTPDSGLNYSIVDISLNGGLGAVTSKNIPLSLGSSGYTKADVYENLTVVGHSNSIDFWLVSRIKSKFLVWKVTSAGFTEPLIFEIGQDLGRLGHQGGIKFSTDGKKLIHCSHLTGVLTSADFDPQTGVLTNIKVINTGVKRFYGVEFSPSGKYVYLSSIENPSWGAVNDVDGGLFIRSIDDLTSPYTRVLPSIANVQLGPDNRIYAISRYSRSLWVILDPDEGGKKIAEFPNFFDSARMPVYGLPPFITSFFNIKPLVGKSLVCVGNPAEYSIEIPRIGSGTQQIERLVWDFGDGTSPVIDKSMSASKTIYKQAHTYEAAGEYTLTVTPYLVNGLPDNTKVNGIKATVTACKIVTNKMIRHDILP